jgi:hypothetical protein
MLLGGVLRRAPVAAPALARAMHLSPRELDHLRLAQVGQLAQRRLARGRKLNHPETVGLISAQVLCVMVPLLPLERSLSAQVVPSASL